TEVEHGWSLIQQHRPLVILCDWTPRVDALALCQRVRQNSELTATYFVAMAARRSRKARAVALEGGVDDQLSRPIDARELLARVRIGFRLIEMQERLFKAAITDGLTGLYNHDHFNRLLDTELSRARRYAQPLALLMIDLDYFKAVNDTFGHLVGNRVLTAVAHTVRCCLRDVDTIARFGGEEFAIITPASTLDDALQIAARIGAAVKSVAVDVLHDHRVTASIGVSSTEDLRVKNAADLVDLADRALYLAKHRGRNQVVGSFEVTSEGEAVGMLQAEDIDALCKRVAVMSVQAKEAYLQSISALVQAMEEKDPYTARHAVNVSFYGDQLARQLGCSEGFVQSVRNAGLLHDIGKVGIPDRILMKSAPLTDLERSVMDQVPFISTRIIEPLRVLETEIQIIRHQREYYDGSGLPMGLAGEQIPLGSRVLLVADAFDAMTTDRIYRPSRSIHEALRDIQSLSGKQFDPRVVIALRQIAELRRHAVQQRIESALAAAELPVEVGS
ncbi:MAG TPA: diguanylate cyclase, partial [Phycisphaerae bacterium]